MSNALSADDIAKSECIELVMRLYRHLDCREYEQIYGLFTPDGSWQRPEGRVHIGPEMKASLESRPPGLLIAHVFSNMAAYANAPDEVEVTGLMTVYRDEKGALAPLPARMSPPTALIEFAAPCRKIDEAWRVAAIDVAYLFKT